MKVIFFQHGIKAHSIKFHVRQQKRLNTKNTLKKFTGYYASQMWKHDNPSTLFYS